MPRQGKDNEDKLASFHQISLLLIDKKHQRYRRIKKLTDMSHEQEVLAVE